LVRSVTPIDRIRFVRNHLRRGVRYDTGLRAFSVDEDEDGVDRDGQRRRPRYSINLAATNDEDKGLVDRAGKGEDQRFKFSAGNDDRMVREFVGNYLRVDGVFLLRLIAHNINGIAATEITKELWDGWYDRRDGQKEAAEALDESTQIKRPID